MIVTLTVFVTYLATESPPAPRDPSAYEELEVHSLLLGRPPCIMLSPLRNEVMSCSLMGRIFSSASSFAACSSAPQTFGDL